MTTERQLRQLQEARIKRWGTKTWHERMWERIEKSEGCWKWKGSCTSLGYGQIQIGPRATRVTHYVHRKVYEELVGPIPEGTEIDHLCHNPNCCNPDHLQAVTHKQNMQRSKAALKMACKRGHDWTNPYNVYIRKNGTRWCAECGRTRWDKKSKWYKPDGAPSTDVSPVPQSQDVGGE